MPTFLYHLLKLQYRLRQFRTLVHMTSALYHFIDNSLYRLYSSHLTRCLLFT